MNDATPPVTTSSDDGGDKARRLIVAVGPLLAAIYQGHWSEVPGRIALWLAVLVPVSLAVSSAVGAYFATAWTLAYRRFDAEGELGDPAPLAA